MLQCDVSSLDKLFYQVKTEISIEISNRGLVELRERVSTQCTFVQGLFIEKKTFSYSFTHPII